MKISDLVDLMRKGIVYVNILTEWNPNGELRGQRYVLPLVNL